jgi:hypothetical protein
MEEQNVSTRSGKGVNWTWIILGAVGLGAVWLFFSNKATAATLIQPLPSPNPNPNPNTDPPIGNDSKYSLGYWAWRIKKSSIWWGVTAQKAKIAGKSFNVQLWEDAQVKVTSGETIGTDLSVFKSLVDARVAQDTSSASADVKFTNAVNYIVDTTVKTGATVYGDLLPKEKPNPVVSMAGIR